MIMIILIKLLQKWNRTEQQQNRKTTEQEDNRTERQQDRKTTGQKDNRTERQQNNMGKQGTWHDI